MARPALHGSMAMIMVAVVISTGRSAPTYPELSDQVVVASTMVGPIWVEVKEIADPVPKRSRRRRQPPTAPIRDTGFE